MSNKILIYEGEGKRIEVQLDSKSETLWLSQKQISELLDTSTDNISLHLKNIYQDKELDAKATTEDYSVVRQEGRREVKRRLKHYNLDAIISVGYRVNSKKGTQFRQWATARLKEYLVKGYTLNQQRLSQASPGTEENNSKDIGILLNAAKQIAAQTEGVVIIIHHSGKDKSKGLRGHSSMNAAMDLCIEVKKDLYRHDWHTSKVKDGDGDIARSFTLAKQELNGTSLKKKVSSCAVKEIDAQRIVKPPTGKNQRPIYEAVKDKLENQDSLPTKEVLEVAKSALPDCNKSRRHTRAKEALKELVEKGYFNTTENGSYSLPET